MKAKFVHENVSIQNYIWYLKIKISYFLNEFYLSGEFLLIYIFFYDLWWQQNSVFL